MAEDLALYTELIEDQGLLDLVGDGTKRKNPPPSVLQSAREEKVLQMTVSGTALSSPGASSPCPVFRLLQPRSLPPSLPPSCLWGHGCSHIPVGPRVQHPPAMPPAATRPPSNSS